MRWVLLAVIIVLTIQVRPLGALDKIAMRVSPAVAFAPANLIVRATVEADKNNRAIEVIAESPEFYRSSQIQLDGDRAPRTTVFEFRSVPSGFYEVRALLIGTQGKEVAMSQVQIQVVPSAKAY